MSDRKLTTELEVKTERARAKLQQALDGIESSSSGGGAADGLSRSLDKAAKSASRFDDEAARGAASMARLVRGFGGMAVGLAASYAAGHMKEGVAKDVVDYAAGAASGAGAGFAMGGPKGAIVGGVAGIAKTAIDKSGQKSEYLEAFAESERRYRSAAEWREKLDSITTAPGAAEELAKLKEAEAKIAASVAEFAERGEYSNADHQQRSLAENRSRQAQLEALEKSLGGRAEERVGEGALDALSRIGGQFAGGGNAEPVKELGRIGEKQLTLLTDIKWAVRGVGTWR